MKKEYLLILLDYNFYTPPNITSLKNNLEKQYPHNKIVFWGLPNWTKILTNQSKLSKLLNFFDRENLESLIDGDINYIINKYHPRKILLFSNNYNSQSFRYIDNVHPLNYHKINQINNIFFFDFHLFNHLPNQIIFSKLELEKNLFENSIFIPLARPSLIASYYLNYFFNLAKPLNKIKIYSVLNKKQLHRLRQDTKKVLAENKVIIKII